MDLGNSCASNVPTTIEGQSNDCSRIWTMEVDGGCAEHLALGHVALDSACMNMGGNNGDSNCDSDSDSDTDEDDNEPVLNVNCSVLSIQPYQAIDIGLGSAMNASVQQDLRNGICGVTADVGLIAEQTSQLVDPPQTGMYFPTGLDFLAACHTYAMQCGFQFSIRTSSFDDNLKKKDRKASDYLNAKLIWLKCKRSGEFVSKSKNPNTTPRTQKTGCKVLVVGGKCGDGFVIRKCILEHNHEMNPHGSRLMVNYRIIGLQEQERLLMNFYAGIPTSKNYRALSVWVGGPEFLKFNENDARNFLKGERRKGMINGDAKAMLSYFEKQQLTNSEFYYDYEIDCDGRLRNVFWADARCRAAYRDFDEVVTFDTTHLCNDYAMPFAVFVGVNHHGSSFIFAFALISHEDSKSFCWVFNNWLRCMGKAPRAFLSDQCKGIRKAVKTVFPESIHRLCIWHLLQNARKNLGAKKDFSKLYNKMNLAVHDTLSLKEFEQVWGEMVREFGLEENAWIKKAYKIRKRWVPGYWRDTFWAGMSSTQRSEQMNRFMKGYLTSNTGLIDFMIECDRFLARKAEIEVQLNNDSFERKLVHESSLPMVKVFQEAYTNSKFEVFLEEVKALAETNAIPVEHYDDIVLLEVSDKVHTPFWKHRKRTYQVSIDKGKEEFLCNCQLFEFSGILCKHVMKAMLVEDIDKVPDKYVLKRWRKNIVRDYEKIQLSYYDPNKVIHLQKYRQLSNVYEQIVATVMGDESAYNLALEEARSSLMKYEAASVLAHSLVNLGTPEKPNNVDMNIFGKRKVVQDGLSSTPGSTDNATPDVVIENPLKKKRGSGRPVKNRRKPAYEYQNKRKRVASAKKDQDSAKILMTGDKSARKCLKVKSKKAIVRSGGQNMRDLGSLYRDD